MTFGGFGGGSNTVKVRIVGDKGDLDKKLRGAERAVGRFSDTTQRKISAAALAIKTGFAVAAVSAVKLATTFDSTMSKITGLVGIAADEVDAMGESLKGISREAAKGPAELANALFFVTSAGLRGKQALEALEFAAKASTAGLGETADVADALTSAMNAYAASGLSAEEATDILVATVREGKLEASELGQAIGKVLPIASEMGVTFDQVGASIAAMTRLGLNSAESVTALRALLATLAKPGKAAAEALTAVGLSSEGLRQQLREDGLLAVLNTLRDAFEGNQEALTKVIPNVRALTGFMSLTGDAADATNTIFENLTDTSGALNTAFETASDTIEFRFNKALTEMKLKALEVRDPLTRFSGQFLPLLSDATHEMKLTVRGINAIKDGVIVAEGPVAEFAAALEFTGGAAASTDETLRLMIDALGIGVDEFDEITGSADAFAKSAGLTRPELDRLLEIILRIKRERFFKDLRDDAGFLGDQLGTNLTPAMDDLADSTDDAAAAVQTLGDRMLAVADPAFNLAKTTSNAAEAQAALNAARDEFGSGSPQFLDAATEAAEATARQNAAQQVFNETFGPQSEETFRILLAAAGLYADEIEIIIENIRRAAEATRLLPPVPTGGGGGGRITGPFHTGGRVNAPTGQEVLVRALGGEQISNPAHGGESGPGGGITIQEMNITVNDDLGDPGAGRRFIENLVGDIEDYTNERLR